MNGSTLVQKLTFGYDPEGNRTSKTDQNNVVTPYGYDQANRLTSYNSTSPTYAYNGDGLRTSKTGSGTTTQETWDVAEGLPLLLQDGTTSYVTGLGGLPLEQVVGKTTSYYHQDRIGSTRAITSSNGGVASTYTYDAYGNLTGSTGTLSNPFQYAGQYTDSESGLQYDRARYYDATVGGFISRDPAAGATRQPYGYVANSPVNQSDPSGLGLVQAGNALLGGAHDVAQNVPAALAYIALGTVVNEHDKLVSGDPLKVTSAVLDILAMASPLAIGLAGKVAIIGVESGAVGAESLAAEGSAVAAESAGVSAGEQAALNRALGNAWRDQLAGELEQLGRDVQTEVYKATPFGRRFIDVDVAQGGRSLGGIEAKFGNSPYTPLRQLKDVWLWMRQGYRVDLVRYPQG